MFRIGSFKSAFTGVKKYIYTHCDDKDEEDNTSADDEYDTPSLIEQVNKFSNLALRCPS